MNFGQTTINQILDILQNINTVESPTTPTCNVPCSCPSGQQETMFCPQGEKAELAGTVSCWPCKDPSNKTCYKCVPETPCCNCTTCGVNLFDPPEENTPCRGCAVADKCEKCQVAGLPIFCFKCPDEENKPNCQCTDQRCIDQGFYDSRAKCKAESGAAECKTESCSHNCCKGSAACYKPCTGPLPKCNCTNCSMYASKGDCETSTSKKCRKAEFGCETFGADCCEINKECWEPCDGAGDPCDCTTCGYYNDSQECTEMNDGLRCSQVDCLKNEGAKADPCCVTNSDCWKECANVNNNLCDCATCGYQSKSDCEAANGPNGCVNVTCFPNNPEDCCKDNTDCWTRAPDCACSMCGYLTTVGCEVECYEVPGCECEEVTCGCTACDNCIPNPNCARKIQYTPTITNTCVCVCEHPGGGAAGASCPGSFAGLYECVLNKQSWEKCELNVCNCSIPGCPDNITTNCYFRVYDPSATTTVSISPTVTPTEKCLCKDCALWNSRNECEADNPGLICVPAQCDSSPPPCVIATHCYEVAPTPTPSPSCIFHPGDFKTKEECEADLSRTQGKCKCKICLEGQPTSSGLDPEWCTCTKQVLKDSMTSDECCEACCNLSSYWNSKEECENGSTGGAPKECKPATSCGACSNCSSKCWIAEILTPTVTDCQTGCDPIGLTYDLLTCEAWAVQEINRKCEKVPCKDPRLACYKKVTITPTKTCACTDIGQGCMKKDRCKDLASPAKCPVGPEQGKKCICVDGCGSRDVCGYVNGQEVTAVDAPCAELQEVPLRCSERQLCFNTEAECKRERDKLAASDRSKTYRCDPTDVSGDRCFCITSREQDCCKPADRPRDCTEVEACRSKVASYGCSRFCRLTSGPSCTGTDDSCTTTTKPCPARPPACPDPNPTIHVYECATERNECKNCHLNKKCMVPKGTPQRPVLVCECHQIAGSCASVNPTWRDC